MKGLLVRDVFAARVKRARHSKQILPSSSSDAASYWMQDDGWQAKHLCGYIRKRNQVAALGHGGVIIGAIGTVLLTQQITTIANAVQYVFPQIGPFDAAITIANPSVIGDSKLTQKAFDRGTVEPAVELQVQFIETTTGRSKLDQCYSELQLSQNKYPSTSQPLQRPSDSQQVVDEKFFLPQKQYGGQATLWRRCIRRVAQPTAFNLPSLQDVSKQQQTTYVVCIGEYQRACGGNATWLGCGSNASKWAQQAHPAECKNVKEQTLSDVGGNKCGYATVQVT